MRERAQEFFNNDPFFGSAMICGLVAGVIGLIYLGNAGAPMTMILVNGLTLTIGLLLALVLRVTLRLEPKTLTAIALGSTLLLLGTALVGHGIEGANRWLPIGPYVLQPSLILLPIVAICYAHRSNLWNSLAVIGSVAAMAIQPDRAMAGMLLACTLLLSFAKPSNGRFTVSLFCAVTFVVTMMIPDNLTAVPFVDHILWTAFDINLVIGMSLWAGCLLLLAPVLLVSRENRQSVHWVFGAGWLAVMASAAFGAYPTPIVGFGASAILGYFLSLVVVEPKPHLVPDEGEEDVTKKAQQDTSKIDLLPVTV
ncbi:MAG: hypothetical protein Pars2KO_13570 [Parasphingorhabdus sp.]